MKKYEGIGGTTPHIPISALDGGEWSASRTGRFCHYNQVVRKMKKSLHSYIKSCEILINSLIQ